MHTPGPWIVEGNTTTGTDSLLVMSDDDYVVASVIAIPDQSHIANAQLIAAAPEMLDAGREIIEYWDCGDDTENLRAAIEMLRAAITKAEGR